MDDRSECEVIWDCRKISPSVSGIYICKCKCKCKLEINVPYVARLFVGTGKENHLGGV